MSKKLKTPRTDLEQQFEDYLSLHQKEIQAKIDQAQKLVEEARQLAEKYGIPGPTVTRLEKYYYVPKSFPAEPFKTLTKEQQQEIAGFADFADWIEGGWSASEFC